MMVRLLFLAVVCIGHFGCAMTTSYGVKPEEDVFDSDKYAFTVFYNAFSSEYDIDKNAKSQIQQFMTEHKYADFEVVKVTKGPLQKVVYEVKFHREARLENRQNPQTQPNNKSGVTGSGFLVNSNGFILTNNHVVEECDQILAEYKGDKVPVSVVAYDAANDLAALKFSKPVQVTTKFRSAHPLKLGEEVVAVGFPLKGLLTSNATPTFGAINALTGIGDDTRFMQISAEVHPGNSGGPLLDSSGNVAGMVVSKLNAIAVAKVTGDIPQNINFALHAAVIKNFMDSHNIQYQISSIDMVLDKTDIAARGIDFTLPIMCE